MSKGNAGFVGENVRRMPRERGPKRGLLPRDFKRLQKDCQSSWGTLGGLVVHGLGTEVISTKFGSFSGISQINKKATYPLPALPSLICTPTSESDLMLWFLLPHPISLLFLIQYSNSPQTLTCCEELTPVSTPQNIPSTLPCLCHFPSLHHYTSPHIQEKLIHLGQDPPSHFKSWCKLADGITHMKTH